jgi:hypothetical protein
VKKAFAEGVGKLELSITDSSQKSKKKNIKKKKSKLDSQGDLIKQLWVKHKSMQKIADILQTYEIYCHRTTVWRFLQKSFCL